MNIKIPRHMRDMYSHAYQSYVWNHMVTRRLELYGAKLVLGDIVLLEETPSNTENESPGALSDSVIVKGKQIVKVLDSESDLSNYSLQDLVLPLPGHDICYPDNDMKKEYQEFMAKDGLDPFNMKRDDW
jgi:tRNA pseudouridine13 synthase